MEICIACSAFWHTQWETKLCVVLQLYAYTRDCFIYRN
jgi:hypothetical protein